MNAQRIRLAALLATLGIFVAGPLPAMADDASDAEKTVTAQAPDPDLLAAVEAARRNDFEGAIRLLEEVVRRDGFNSDAYAWLAYALWRQAEVGR